MRVLFWRRKNARFVSRLNTVVETSERSKRSFRSKPRRVEIDTSYVEPQYDEGEGYEDEYDENQEGAEAEYGEESEGATNRAGPHALEQIGRASCRERV